MIDEIKTTLVFVAVVDSRNFIAVVKIQDIVVNVVGGKLVCKIELHH
jgi:hypothetical protein